MDKTIQHGKAYILYDNAITPQFNPTWFEQNGERLAAGRLSVTFFSVNGEEYVLKHYARGGFAAQLSTDRYVYTGHKRVRSFAEWRVLKYLYRHQLPVPLPIAARYQRTGALYTADLITRSCRPARPLPDILQENSIGDDWWHLIGTVIRRFHAAGVCHPDLNVSNILLDKSTKQVTLLDFDKARINQFSSSRQQANLRRLQRSMEKLRRQNPNIHLSPANFQVLSAAWAGTHDCM